MLPAADPADRSRLTADCGSCFGLCCVALPFAASADFALDKPAGDPCVHLRTDFRCGIHAELRTRGFRGCTVFDCFGAGQKVSQQTFAGRDWRGSPETARQMFAVLPVMRGLHELSWYLTEALAMPAAAPVHEDLRAALVDTDRLTGGSAEDLLGLDLVALRDRVNPVLQRASELVRGPGRVDHRGADLMGGQLAGADLRGANLRGALLVAADLRRADLGLADVTGADLRDADLRGADLSGVLFLTRTQLDSARGDAGTALAEGVARPGHWEGSADRN